MSARRCLKIVVALAALAPLLALTGCLAPRCVNAEGNTVLCESLNKRVVGTLSMKGSEFNAWWALADDQGQVWRLVTKDEALMAQLSKWQHQRVEIQGKLMGKYLATEQLEIQKAALAQ